MNPELLRMVWGLYRSEERMETYLALFLVLAGALTIWYRSRSSRSLASQPSV